SVFLSAPSLASFSLLPCLSVSNVSPPPAIYALSLHDALPISGFRASSVWAKAGVASAASAAPRQRESFTCKSMTPLNEPARRPADRKSTRLNSSHVEISYAVFCLKKKKKTKKTENRQTN